MLDSMNLPSLLAQEPHTVSSDLLNFTYILLSLALVVGVPILLGTLLGRWLRMRGYEWKLSLIFLTLVIASFVVVRSYDFKTGKFNMPMGVDLKGGVVLIYEAQSLGGTSGTQANAASEDLNMGDLVQALTKRINPSGTKEIVIRPYGERQVEIIIPEVDAAEIDSIKRQISTAGNLEFRIVANTRDHEATVALAEAQAKDPDPAKRISKFVRRGDKTVGFWAQGDRKALRAAEVESTIVRNAATGDFLDFRTLPQPIKSADQTLGDFLDANKLENVDILVETDDGCDVTGSNLGMVSGGTSQYLEPSVHFRLKGEGIGKFQALTGANTPDLDSSPPFYRHLGIVLDDKLLSFPRLKSMISDQGEITGGFDAAEVDFLVGILRAGRLPATLSKDPISENRIGSMLGEDTIEKGKVAIFISMVVVFFCTAVYYRFAGIVACAALAANLLFVFAIMILVKAPLTMPGLAGLALTVGMSVDANVLIFERIREELARGAGIRMAIRNGFDRATITIVDSNLTTLITGVVLYVIGTDQIRGFAITLILGLLAGMFTAVFCSRVVFDIWERKGWLKSLHMMQFLGETHLDFVGKWRICLTGSIVLLVISVGSLIARGKGLFDIDFTGGVSVTMVLNESMPPDEVRSRLDKQFANRTPAVQCTVNSVGVKNKPANSVYKVDAGLESTDELEKGIQEAFRGADGKNLLAVYSMAFADVKSVPIVETPAAPPAATPPAATPPAEAAPVTPAAPAGTAPATPPAEAAPAPAPTTEPAAPAEAAPNPPAPPETDKAPESGAPKLSLRTDLPDESVLAWAGPDMLALQEEPAPAAAPAAETPPPAPAAETAPATEKPADQPAAVAPPAETTGSPSADVTPDDVTPDDVKPATSVTLDTGLRTVAKLTFGEEIEINAPTLRDQIRVVFNKMHGANEMDEVPGLVVDPDGIFDWNQGSSMPSAVWYVRMMGTPEDATALLGQMKQDLANTPVFPASSEIGSQVAGDTRTLAVVAIVVSCFGIIVYLWIRFQHVIFGLAAVIALVHDVTITLGAIAVSAYVANILGFLLIDEFKINLTVVAAILTIIGYSVNDTIVVFDRIREVRGKSPRVTVNMVNLSVNQTLSRTLLTGVTTLLVTVIMYIWGGAGIHAFSFCFTIGVLVGTFSSIYVASPVMLWMLNRDVVRR
jgi:SecD/SecF fusion protein